MRHTYQNPRYYFILLFAAAVFSLQTAGPAFAGNLPFGSECKSNGECRSNDCEDSDIKGKRFCDCSFDNDCSIQYGVQPNEEWDCIDGADLSHDLDYCQSTLRGSLFPIATGTASFLDFFLDSEAALRVTQDELIELSKEPQLRIKIPGLNFSEPEVFGGEGELGIRTPFLAEYIFAVYQYALIVGGVVAVVMIIVGGLKYTISGGSSDKTGDAKKHIGNAVTGIVLLLFTYIILNQINPELVSFKNISLNYIAAKSLDDTVYEDRDLPDSYVIPKPRKITDTSYDEIFKQFGNCIDADWRILKAFAYKESGLNHEIVNRKGFIGLFQTKPPNCRDALKPYPAWSAHCEELKDPYVNTAVGSMMLKHGLKRVKQTCGAQVDVVIGGGLLYLNHNSGGLALKHLLANGACTSQEKLVQEIKTFWIEYMQDKVRNKAKKQKREPTQAALDEAGAKGRAIHDGKSGSGRGVYSLAVGLQIQQLGVTDFFDTSQNGTGACPLEKPPSALTAPSS